MFRLALATLLFSAAVAGQDNVRGSTDVSERSSHRELSSFFYTFFPRAGTSTWKVTMTNLSYNQPLGPAFVVVHGTAAAELFTLGGVAGAGLTELAENGSPAILVDEYTGAEGVLSTAAEADGGPLFAGESRDFMITTDFAFPFFSMASMAINTNDCFVGHNMVRPRDGMILYSPGYDSGTEANNESCTHIPGPACEGFTKTDDAPAGEGVIHVHRGVHGIGDLAAETYDWRNPMMKVEISRVFV